MVTVNNSNSTSLIPTTTTTTTTSTTTADSVIMAPDATHSESEEVATNVLGKRYQSFFFRYDNGYFCLNTNSVYI